VKGRNQQNTGRYEEKRKTRRGTREGEKTKEIGKILRKEGFFEIYEKVRRKKGRKIKIGPGCNKGGGWGLVTTAKKNSSQTQENARRMTKGRNRQLQKKPVRESWIRGRKTGK